MALPSDETLRSNIRAILSSSNLTYEHYKYFQNCIYSLYHHRSLTHTMTELAYGPL
jgi:hypothetical protein